MVFVGWDPPLQRFFLTIAELCKRCDGTGEEPDSDNFCAACGAEGVDWGAGAPAGRDPPSTLDEIAAELSRLEIPFPDHVRADLEHDRRTNAGSLVHAYE
jgi:hypothetical protein